MRLNCIVAVVSLLLIGVTGLSAYEPVREYDPSRDASKDIEEAVAEASRTHRRVLLEIGGEWCVWCHILDDFWKDHTEVTEFRDAHFILVKINMSQENKNEETLSRYPKVGGYPHFFVLDSDGSFLHSQDTGELESGDRHSKKKVRRFLEAWAPTK